jgi:uncharacterized membrane protein SirB2
VDYSWLKSSHQLLALISVCGFMLRWYWRVAGSPMAQLRLTKTLPHIVDTLFLITGVALTWKLSLFSALPGWLAAKLTGLVVYILLGAVAMRCTSRLALSTGVFLTALTCFGWIISVAITKSPFGFLLVIS